MNPDWGYCRAEKTVHQDYEDNTSGRLTDERYDMLSQTYEAEQKQLEAEAITLQQEIEVQEWRIESILIAFGGKVRSITIITWMVAQRLVAEILLMSVMQLKKGRYSVER